MNKRNKQVTRDTSAPVMLSVPPAVDPHAVREGDARTFALKAEMPIPIGLGIALAATGAWMTWWIWSSETAAETLFQHVLNSFNALSAWLTVCRINVNQLNQLEFFELQEDPSGLVRFRTDHFGASIARVYSKTEWSQKNTSPSLCLFCYVWNRAFLYPQSILSTEGSLLIGFIYVRTCNV